MVERYPELPPDFGHWLAGFIDGEGCFSIQLGGKGRGGPAPRFTLGLRDDDRSILEEIVRRTSIGKLYIETKRPVVRWWVGRRSDLAALVRLLDAFPLRAKKLRDYAIWREAVVVYCEMQGYGDGNGDRGAALTEIAERLKAVRERPDDETDEEVERQTAHSLGRKHLQLRL